MKKLNITRVLYLISVFITHKEVKKDLFIGLKAIDLEEMLRFSMQQGVNAIAFASLLKIWDEIDKCDEEKDALILVLMKWTGYSWVIKRNYSVLYNSAKQFMELMRSSNVNVLLFKGFAMNSFYPDPTVRSFGDFDFYSFGEHKKVAKIVEEFGIKVDYYSKHDIFDFHSCHIELHKYFVKNDTWSGRLINGYLLSIAKISNFKKQEEGWLVPSIEFNAIYLLRHMADHLGYEGVTLKNLVDWALFLKSLNPSEVKSNEKVLDVLKRSKMLNIWNAFTEVTCNLFKVDLHDFIIGDVDKKMIVKLESEIIKTQLHAEQRCFLPLRLVKKTQRLFKRKWMYECGLLPGNYWREIVWSSFIGHILDSRNI